MKLLLPLVAIVCVLIVLIAAFVWSGIYSVAATVPHQGITLWFLEKVREQSISAHSKGIITPSLKGPKLFDIGFKNYHAMCRLCHGAPGYSRTQVAQGLYPLGYKRKKRMTTIMVISNVCNTILERSIINAVQL